MNETNIKIVIGSKPLSDGKFSVYLRITKKKKKKEIAMGLRCKKENFDNEKFTKQHPNYQIENELILKFKTNAFKIIREFQLREYDFSLDEFEIAFRGEKNVENDIILFFDEIIQEMERAGRMGNARAYKETKDALLKYRGTNILFKDVTPTFLEKFEVFMRERGNEEGGIAFKMRELRAVFNKAINRGFISQELYPFKHYKISKLKTKKNKRALTIEEFKKIRDLDLTRHPHLIILLFYWFYLLC